MFLKLSLLAAALAVGYVAAIGWASYQTVRANRGASWE